MWQNSIDHKMIVIADQIPVIPEISVPCVEVLFRLILLPFRYPFRAIISCQLFGELPPDDSAFQRVRNGFFQ